MRDVELSNKGKGVNQGDYNPGKGLLLYDSSILLFISV